jgi:hypothetical protein
MLAVLAGCANGTSEVAEPPGAVLLDGTGHEVVFLTLDRVPGAHMEALFDGPLVLDAQGCLRGGDEEAATFIWPYGFDAVPGTSGLEIRDRDGGLVGRPGESVRLGGGIVATLHGGIPMDPGVRETARTRCPGRYWIVGEVY